MKISELYQQPASETTFALCHLSRHISIYCENYDEEVNKKINIRILKYWYIDGRSYVQLATVWF
jgi:hypothetical protein